MCIHKIIFQRDFLADSKKAASRNLRRLAITAGPPGPPCPTVALLRDTVEDEEAQTRLVLILCTERDLLVHFLGVPGQLWSRRNQIASRARMGADSQ